MLQHQTDADDRQLFELSFGKRPAEELYDCLADPDQTKNLADDSKYESAKKQLADRLTAYLKETGDPRETSGSSAWDDWPYYGYNQWKVLPESE